MSGAASRDEIVVGTAGHIDHGKSTLVRALTGTDPDRLAEEKRRGITIDLGFAHTDIGGYRFAFVDVPGHERFVHNMLAGATGVDLVLMVVAADESVMPQTREHLGICRLLGLRAGVVAITRIDLVEGELVELVEQEVADLVAGTFLQDAPVVRVSGATGAGLEALRDALVEAARKLPPRAEESWARLPIDRAFAAPGFGTIVTGTLHGGSIAVDDRMALLPGGRRVRVRGLQVHGEPVARANPPRRVAVNLHGASRSEIERGMVLVPEGCEVVARAMDAMIEVLGEAPVPLRHGQRVRVHHGTAEVMGRVLLPARDTIGPGETGPVQIRLEKPLAALPGDRFVIRRYSPVTTLGGGVVADVAPPRWKRSDRARAERVRRWAAADPEGRLRLAAEAAGRRGLRLSPEILRRLALPPIAEERLRRGEAVGLLVAAGRWAFSESGYEELCSTIAGRLAEHHAEHPLEPGPALEPLRAAAAPALPPEVFRAVVERGARERRWVVEKENVRLPEHAGEPAGGERRALEKMLAGLEEAGLEAVESARLRELAGVDEARAARLLAYAVRAGLAVRVKGERYIGAGAWERLVARLEALRREGRETIGIADFKRLFGLTRKHAIPLLERLDDAGVTRRVGDARRLQGAPERSGP
ncbi:MAG: selenocysteine-specific translation elongation factor [Acidobacteria bacterium]|nr:MAG: selenocysteine-specific translation elongation factor [Acidobacteriota bacterium]